MAEEKQLKVVIRADTEALEQGLKRATASLNAFSEKAKALGDKVASLGMKLTKGLTLPLAGIGGTAIKMSVDFNKAMANVATLIPGNVERVKALKKQIQDLAIATGKSTTDLAGGLYQVISAFGDTGNSMDVLSIAAKSATAGLSSTTDAINLLAAVMKGYGDTSTEMARKTSDLAFMTVKLGQTTFPELASSIGRVVPLAATLGVKVEELFAGFATLTGITGDTAEVSTQLAAILRAMIKPTTDMREAIHRLGYTSADAMLKDLGLVGALKKLVGTTDGSKEAIARLFGRAEALTAVFALLGSQSETFKQKLEALKNSAGATEQAFNEQTKGINKAGFTFLQFRREVEVLLQRLGDELAPALKSIVGALKPLIRVAIDLVKAFASLPGPVKTFIIAIGGIITVAGPFLTITGMMIRNIGILAGSLAKMPPVGVKVAGTLGKIGAVGASAFVGWQIGRAIGKLTGLDKVLQNVFEKLLNITGLVKSEGGTVLGDYVKRMQAVNAEVMKLAQSYVKEGETIRGVYDAYVILAQHYDEVRDKVPIEALTRLKRLHAKLAETARNSATKQTSAHQQATEATLRNTAIQSETLQNFKATVQEVYDSISQAEQSYTQGSLGLFEGFFGAIGPMWAGFLTMAQGGTQMLGQSFWQMSTGVSTAWTNSMTTIQAKTGEMTQNVGQKMTEFQKNIKKISENITSTLTSTFRDAIIKILQGFDGLWKKGVKFTDKLKEAFKSLVDGVISALREMVAQIIVSAIKTVIAKKVEAIASVIASVMASVPFPVNLVVVGGAIAAVAALFSALHLAEGGLVQSPTLALVGEAGPELVIPLNKVRETLGGGGVVINQTVNFYGDVKSDVDIETMLELIAERTKEAVMRGMEE